MRRLTRTRLVPPAEPDLEDHVTARIRALLHRQPRVSAEYRKLARDLEQLAAIMERPGAVHAVHRVGLPEVNWTGR